MEHTDRFYDQVLECSGTRQAWLESLQQGHPATDHSHQGVVPQPEHQLFLQLLTMHQGTIQPHPQHSGVAQPSACAACQGQVLQLPVAQMARHNLTQSRAEPHSVPADRHPTNLAIASAISPQPALLEGAPAACDGALEQSAPLQSAPATCDSARAQSGHSEAAPAAAWAGAPAPAAWEGAHSCRWHPTDAAQTPPETAQSPGPPAWHHQQSPQQTGQALGQVSPQPQQQVGTQVTTHVRLHSCYERGSRGLQVMSAI